MRPTFDQDALLKILNSKEDREFMEIAYKYYTDPRSEGYKDFDYFLDDLKLCFKDLGLNPYNPRFIKNVAIQLLRHFGALRRKDNTDEDKKLHGHQVDAITYVFGDLSSAIAGPDGSVPTNEEKEENLMSPLKLKTQVLLDGQVADRMDDDELYAAIARAESEITDMESIQNKPKKLEAKIAEKKKRIAELVAYIDERGNDAA